MNKTPDDANTPRTIEAVNKACRILRSVHELNGAGVTELANHLDITKGTVHTHLTTLKQNGLIVKEEDTYSASLRFLDIGEDVKNQSKIYKVAKDGIEELAEETDTRTQIAVEESGMAVVLAIRRGEHAIAPPTQVGKRDYLHCIASGKAMLANMPQENVEAIIEQHGLPERTPNTITDPGKLFEELAEIRERGIAFNDQEKMKGLRAVGKAIQDDTGAVIGAISASGPTSGLQGDRFRKEVPGVLSSIAETIELNIRVEKNNWS